MHRDDMITCELIWQGSGSEAAAQGNGATSDEIVIWLHFCHRDPPKMNTVIYWPHVFTTPYDFCSTDNVDFFVQNKQSITISLHKKSINGNSPETVLHVHSQP